jgi:hypothetical protein
VVKRKEGCEGRLERGRDEQEGSGLKGVEEVGLNNLQMRRLAYEGRDEGSCAARYNESKSIGRRLKSGSGELLTGGRCGEMNMRV